MRALTLGATLAWLVAPAWAQDEEEPAAPDNREPAAADESAAAGATGASSGPSRRAALRAWHAKRQAALALKAQAAAEREAAERKAAEATPQPAPQPSHAEAKLDGAGLDSQPQDTLDTLPAAGPTEAIMHSEHAAAAPAEHAENAHGQAAHDAAERGAAHGESHGEHAGFSVKTFVLAAPQLSASALPSRFGSVVARMNKSLRARHEQLKGDIDEAARLRDEAKRKFEAQEQRLAELEKEIAALRESIRQGRRAASRHACSEAAQERAKRIQRRCASSSTSRSRRPKGVLRAEVASASVKLAEELVRKSVNTDDERRLAREFVAGFDDADRSRAGEVR